MATPENKKIGWGLLSTAAINRAILAAMPNSPRGAIVAVGSRDQARAEAYAAERNIPRAHGSYEALLADPEVQVVYISLPNSLHAEWTIKALEAGKHVLCEKPFALTLADVDAMFAAAQANHRVLAEAFMYRHHPRIIKARELVQSGAIGEPRVLHATFSFSLDKEVNVRWDPALGGGALWDAGCYTVSLARYLFGAPDRVAGWQRLVKSGVDGTFAGALHFPNGSVAMIDCSFQAPFRAWAEVAGSTGVLRLDRPYHADQPAASLTLRTKESDEEQTFEVPNPERYLLEIEDMHSATLDGTAPLISPAETRGVIETILDLYASAAQQKEVPGRI